MPNKPNISKTKRDARLNTYYSQAQLILWNIFSSRFKNATSAEHKYIQQAVLTINKYAGLVTKSKSIVNQLKIWMENNLPKDQIDKYTIDKEDLNNLFLEIAKAQSEEELYSSIVRKTRKVFKPSGKYRVKVYDCPYYLDAFKSSGEDICEICPIKNICSTRSIIQTRSQGGSIGTDTPPEELTELERLKLKQKDYLLDEDVKFWKEALGSKEETLQPKTVPNYITPQSSFLKPFAKEEVKKFIIERGENALEKEEKRAIAEYIELIKQSIDKKTEQIRELEKTAEETYLTPQEDDLYKDLVRALYLQKNHLYGMQNIGKDKIPILLKYNKEEMDEIQQEIRKFPMIDSFIKRTTTYTPVKELLIKEELVLNNPSMLGFTVLDDDLNTVAMQQQTLSIGHELKETWQEYFKEFGEAHLEEYYNPSNDNIVLDMLKNSLEHPMSWSDINTKIKDVWDHKKQWYSPLVAGGAFIGLNAIYRGGFGGAFDNLMSNEIGFPCLLGALPLPHANVIDVARSQKILKFRASASTFLAHQMGGLDAIRIEGFLYRKEIPLILFIWMLQEWCRGHVNTEMFENIPTIDVVVESATGEVSDLIPILRKTIIPTKYYTDSQVPYYEVHNTFPLVTRNIIIPNCYIETITFEEKVVYGKDALSYTIMLRTWGKPKNVRVYEDKKTRQGWYGEYYSSSFKSNLTSTIELALNSIWRTTMGAISFATTKEWKITKDMKGNDISFDYDIQDFSNALMLNMIKIANVGNISLPNFNILTSSAGVV